MHRLRIFEQGDIDRFCDFLRAVQVRIDAIEGLIVTASLPGAPTQLHERRELGGYVTTWNALNPSSLVEVDE